MVVGTWAKLAADGMRDRPPASARRRTHRRSRL